MAALYLCDEMVLHKVYVVLDASIQKRPAPVSARHGISLISVMFTDFLETHRIVSDHH